MMCVWWMMNPFCHTTESREPYHFTRTPSWSIMITRVVQFSALLLQIRHLAPLGNKVVSKVAYKMLLWKGDIVCAPPTAVNIQLSLEEQRQPLTPVVDLQREAF